jgi:hypothetical protein
VGLVQANPLLQQVCLHGQHRLGASTMLVLAVHPLQQQCAGACILQARAVAAGTGLVVLVAGAALLHAPVQGSSAVLGAALVLAAVSQLKLSRALQKHQAMVRLTPANGAALRGLCRRAC